MNITQKLIDDIFTEIEKKNSELNPQSVPHSDTFIKHLLSTMGVSAETARLAIKLLTDAHKIFVMEIVADDDRHNVEKVEGYIAADRVIIAKLKTFFQDLLCQMYERQFNKHLLIHQVIKELFPIIKSFNNTELGLIANKTIMLMEFERFLEKDFSEYTEEFKEQKMCELAAHENITYIPKTGIAIRRPDFENSGTSQQFTSTPPIGASHASFGRATDSAVYQDFSEKKSKYPLQRIVNIYGIDFFIKVNLRKCQFSYITQIVEDHQISKKDDLILLKGMIDKVKANISHDKELERYRSDIYALEKAVTHAIYFTQKPKKH
jgi:hypothetical protein